MSQRLYVLLSIAGAIVAASAAAPTAYALPELAESAGLTVTDALTLYPDSDNPNLYYFMPNSSTFAVDATSGLPEFGFTYWGLDNPSATDSGAYMTFSLRLTSDASQKAALTSAIASGKQISVLPVAASMVGLNPSSQQGQSAGALSKFFSEFDFAPEGGLAEDDVGVNAVLTPIGAKVFKASIDNPQLIKFDYCYKTQGLGPDEKATISVDMQRVYTDFQAHASVGGWFWSAQINTEIESLRQQNAIVIDIQGGDATMEEYVRSVADEIVQRLFTVELPDTPVAGSGDNGMWGFDRVQLNYTNISELKQETWTYDKQDLTLREFCLDLGLGALGPYKGQVVKDADAPNS